MANLTTCSKCTRCYEAGSEEQANEPGRLCRACFDPTPPPNYDPTEPEWFTHACEAAMRAWDEDWPHGFASDDAAVLFLDCKAAVRAFLRRASDLGYGMRAHETPICQRCGEHPSRGCECEPNEVGGL